MTPRATYRLQLHREFTLADAEALVPYLGQLGISHIYASPITTAVPGSMHGYDVIDPTRVNPELCGEEALRSLVAALRARGMGLIIDIVPNHMGVAGGHNRYWNDVLQHGQASEYADWFDIDWRQPVLLPILGAPLPQVLAEGQIRLDRSGAEPAIVAYDEHRLPVRPEDRADLPADGDQAGLEALLARQHYRLAWWRQANDELNWRRFFTINDLAGLRVEDEAVFEATHALYLRLYEEGLIDGVRVDHVDGLTDPAGYCQKLRERLDGLERPAGAPPGPAYIVVEKILATGETLPRDWPVDGTSGYDFMEEISLLLHEPAGQEPLETLWRSFSGRELSFHEEELQARRDLLARAFEAQLQACVEALHQLALSAPETAGLTQGMLRRAVERMLAVFPVYRTYGTGTAAPPEDAAVRERVREDVAQHALPGEMEPVDQILSLLAGDGPGDPGLATEAVRRFQQLSAPIAAKAVEDTAFYRYAALLSRLNVGFDPNRFACTVDQFHEFCRFRDTRFPASMLATATHDHKRGEDVRSRLAVLSVIPQVWQERVQRWDDLAGGAGSGVDAADRYVLYQMVFGAWPEGLGADDESGLASFAERLANWQQKALREAKLRSSWQQQDEEYEAAACAFLMQLLEPESSPVMREVAEFVGETSGAMTANMLVQAGLHLTAPGMPDLYQGTELPDFSMVDPDNRRPVDYSVRRAMLTGEAAQHPKLALIARLLDLRRRAPTLFAAGSYQAATVSGARAEQVLAFTRRHEERTLRCAFAIRCGAALLGRSEPVPPREWWRDTSIDFSDGPQANAAGLFSETPVYVELS